jgi:hypothetical protein
MSDSKFFQATRVIAPIPNQRGGRIERYIIAVKTRDPEDKPYDNLVRRANDAFNLALNRSATDTVDLTEIDEKDVPHDQLEKVIFRHESTVYRVKSQ